MVSPMRWPSIAQKFPVSGRSWCKGKTAGHADDRDRFGLFPFQFVDLSTHLAGGGKGPLKPDDVTIDLVHDVGYY